MKFKLSLLTLLVFVIASTANDPIMDHFIKKAKKDKIKEQQRNRDRDFILNLHNHPTQEKDRSLRAGNCSLTVVIVDTLGNLYDGYNDPQVYDKYGYTYSLYERSGKWIATGLHPGEYTVGVENFGANSHTLGDPINWYVISSGNVVADTFVYIPPAINSADTVTFSGTIYLGDSDTVTIANATIMSTLYGIGEFGRIDPYKVAQIYGTSNTDGTFSLKGKVPPGKYYAILPANACSWYKDGTNNVAAYKWFTDEEIGEVPSVIDVNGDVEGLSLHVKKGGIISGKITNPPTGYDYATLYCVNSDGYSMGIVNIGEGDGSFTFSGLPTGEYYVKTQSWDITYKGDYFYPGTLDFNNATKISVVDGETVSDISFTLRKISSDITTGPSRDAVLKGVVSDSSGLPVNTSITAAFEDIDGMSYSYSTNSGSDGEFEYSIPSGYSFYIYTEDDEDMYSGVWSYKNGATYKLSSRDTMDVQLKSATAGSIAGTIKDSQGNGMKEQRIVLEYDLIAIGNNGNSASASLGKGIPASYRITSCPLDNYNVSGVPFYYTDGDPLDEPLNGIGASSAFDISVNEMATTETNLVGPSASAMISGTYSFEDSLTFQYIVYCIKEDGTYASVCLGAYGLGVGEDFGKSLITRDAAVWNGLRSVNGRINAQIDLPLLTVGDYYIAVLSIQESGYQIQWYGQAGSKKFDNNNSGEFIDQLGKVIIPSDAEKIIITEPNQHIKGLDFGRTPINKNKDLNKSNIFKVVSVSKEKLLLSLGNLFGNEASVKLYNVNGQMIAAKEFQKGKGKVFWDLKENDLSSGFYLIKYADGVNRITKPIIIR